MSMSIVDTYTAESLLCQPMNSIFEQKLTNESVILSNKQRWVSAGRNLFCQTCSLNQKKPKKLVSYQYEQSRMSYWINILYLGASLVLYSGLAPLLPALLMCDSLH